MRPWATTMLLVAAGCSRGALGVGNDGGTVMPPSCAGSCSAAQAGASCAPARCTTGSICLCDGGRWQCNACEPLCPDAPADGTSCGHVGSACLYDNGEECLCAGNSAGPYAWQCSKSTGCPSQLPVAGASCPFALTCDYQGADWNATCSCGDAKTWSCTLDACPGAVAGDDCTGVPRQYSCLFQNDPNQYQSCACFGDIGPLWKCAARNCPKAQPPSGSNCDGLQGVGCTYGVTFCGCPQIGNTWQCAAE